MSEQARYTKTWDYREFVNSLRECLGKDPLYGKAADSEYRNEYSANTAHSRTSVLVTFPEYEGVRRGEVRQV